MDPIETRDLPSGGAPSVVASLRQLIMAGRYAAGTRLAEVAVAELLGVSRTPVRLAFRTLAQEGLLQPAGKRGFVVRAFSEADVLCGIEVRGVLEGLAARRLAERGLDPVTRATLEACLAEGEAVLAGGTLGEPEIDRWSRLNERFHGAIVHAVGSQVIADAIARNNHLPFASADSIVIDRSALAGEYEKIRLAQVHHRLIVDALARGESARAEMLMREHAYVGLRYAPLFGLQGASAA
ncbi:GntR family transcriptional regulator [Ideonella azotifigens]|uniref:FCD domain-containing protein n=1 Tax=Ideonella azotifigens TaxID=513160 RepID=A0ABN1KDX0_9BURK|nr:GntR family transcriptional regulator [Ideonella azotifigens]MCD2344555.1 GntR family transcriptional regulator [Ideonella azotifigens]